MRNRNVFTGDAANVPSEIYTLKIKVYPESIPNSYLHLLDVHNVHELSLSEVRK